MRQQQCRKKINSNSSKLQVQLDFIPEIEVLYNLRYGILKMGKEEISQTAHEILQFLE